MIWKLRGGVVRRVRAEVRRWEQERENRGEDEHEWKLQGTEGIAEEASRGGEEREGDGRMGALRIIKERGGRKEEDEEGEVAASVRGYDERVERTVATGGGLKGGGPEELSEVESVGGGEDLSSEERLEVQRREEGSRKAEVKQGGRKEGKQREDRLVDLQKEGRTLSRRIEEET
ncbi:hypothetical protein Tco_0312078 [Tanacetum coccineum]